MFYTHTHTQTHTYAHTCMGIQQLHALGPPRRTSSPWTLHGGHTSPRRLVDEDGLRGRRGKEGGGEGGRKEEFMKEGGGRRGGGEE